MAFSGVKQSLDSFEKKQSPFAQIAKGLCLITSANV